MLLSFISEQSKKSSRRGVSQSAVYLLGLKESATRT
jgi:hypothetical protein